MLGARLDHEDLQIPAVLECHQQAKALKTTWLRRRRDTEKILEGLQDRRWARKMHHGFSVQDTAGEHVGWMRLKMIFPSAHFHNFRSTCSENFMSIE